MNARQRGSAQQRRPDGAKSLIARKSAPMIKKLNKFVEGHPYLPLMLMAGLDMAGYVIEDSSGESGGAVVSLWDRLHNAFLSVGGFLELFPEEIFVAVTAYGLSLKMRKIEEDEKETKKVVDKFKKTAEFMESTWERKGGSGKLRGR